MKNLGALENIDSWVKSMVNGHWERHNGIKIETTENPGWMMKIDLSSDFQKKSDVIKRLVKDSIDIEGMIENDVLYLYSNNLILLFEGSAYILNILR